MCAQHVNRISFAVRPVNASLCICDAMNAVIARTAATSPTAVSKRLTNRTCKLFYGLRTFGAKRVRTKLTRMLAINVSIPNLTVARLEQFPSPQMTDNKPSFTR